MGEASRFGLALVLAPLEAAAPEPAAFPSNWRIWRSSFRSGRLLRVMPWSFVASCAPSGNRKAPAAAPRSLAYRRNFFHGRFLSLSKIRMSGCP